MHHLPFKESATTGKKTEESSIQGEINQWVGGIPLSVLYGVSALFKNVTVDNCGSNKWVIMRKPDPRSLLFQGF